MAQNLISSIGPIMQLAFVPDDFDAALAHWTKTMGAGPFFWVEHAILENKKFEGQPSDVDFGLALGYWGDMQIELIKQHNDAPSIYHTQPYCGHGGIHHVCLLTDNIETARAKTEAAGGKIAFTADAGDGAVFYAHTGGAEGMVEVLQMGAGMQDFFDMIKAASIGWDGSDPLRG
jgi:methylmalonyl-CoA/ethylmalonyl-CoA epimerase